MHLWYGITLPLPLAPNSWTVSQLIVLKQEFTLYEMLGTSKTRKGAGNTLDMDR
jgi:hypothetical protein